MAVFRVEKNANYTTMSNYHLRDKQLSLKAKGLLSFCLSLPDTWDYSIMGLAAVCKEGRDCIMSTLQELEELGYLRRERTRNADGTLAGGSVKSYAQICFGIWQKSITGGGLTAPWLLFSRQGAKGQGRRYAALARMSVLLLIPVMAVIWV